MKIKPKGKRLLACFTALTVILSTFPVQAATGDVRTVGSLPKGSIVYDPTWIWEYIPGENRNGSGVKKQVEWIVVAHNHYTNPTAGTVAGDHTTLISKENVANVSFDNSTNRGAAYGSNHWGNSGTPNATLGVRTWLQNGFYSGSMPSKLKNVILETTLPNKTYSGGNYTTVDKVFIPTSVEMGGSMGILTPIGSNWGYFTNNSSRLVPKLGQYNYQWLRSPYTDGTASGVVWYDGSISNGYDANSGWSGVRPVINIKASTTVREVGPGIYELTYNSPPELTITNPTDQTINASGIITISGTVKDVDNETVTISATINGIAKSTVVSNTSIEQEWSLSWTGVELAEGIAETTTVLATDSPAG